MAASTSPVLLGLVPVLVLFLTTTTITTITARPSPTDFIKSSCKATLYRSLCEESLSSHASSIGKSPRALAHAALSVSLSRTRRASALVSRISASSRAVHSRQGGAVRDCIETMRDGVDRLRRSVKEMDRMGSGSFDFHLSNVQTWVSAALTDESTCLDGLRKADALDHSTRAAVRKEIVKVAHVTSNALAFVNNIPNKKHH